MREALAEQWRKQGPAIAITAIALIFVVWSYSYDGSSRQFPLMVGYATLVLGILDLIARSDLPMAQTLRRCLGATASNERAPSGALRRELVAMLWISGFVMATLLIGILAAAPIYIIAAMMLQGRKPLRHSLIAAVSTTVFLWFVFEVCMSYTLYRGVFLDMRGFQAW